MRFNGREYEFDLGSRCVDIPENKTDPCTLRRTIDLPFNPPLPLPRVSKPPDVQFILHYERLAIWIRDTWPVSYTHLFQSHVRSIFHCPSPSNHVTLVLKQDPTMPHGFVVIGAQLRRLDQLKPLRELFLHFHRKVFDLNVKIVDRWQMQLNQYQAFIAFQQSQIESLETLTCASSSSPICLPDKALTQLSLTELEETVVGEEDLLSDGTSSSSSSEGSDSLQILVDAAIDDTGFSSKKRKTFVS